MKITQKQLRKIIREELILEYGGRPYDPTVPGDQRRSPTGDAPPGGAFDAKVEKMADEIGDRAAGGYEPSIDGSPEAYAEDILDSYLQNPPPPLDQMEDLEYVLTKPMYREQVKNAVLEYIGMMTEGKKIKVKKRQLRRIVKEALDINQLSLEDLEYEHTELMGHLSGQASSGGDIRDIETMGEEIVNMRDRMHALRTEQGLPEKDYSDNVYYSAEKVVQGEIKYRQRGH